MCRLLGIVANREVDFEFSLLGDVHRNLRSQSEGNPDGWGIAVFRGDIPIIEKAPRKAAEDRIFDKFACSIRGKMLIAHVRNASTGNNKLTNTHPFSMDNWVFAHNGIISNKQELENYIVPYLKEKIRGDTDSERYFALILSNFIKDGISSNSEIHDLFASLKSSIQIVRNKIGGNGLNFLLSNGKLLFVYKNGRDLYYLIRDPENIPEELLQSKETGALLHWKKSAGERAILIASEKVTQSENWQTILDDEIICVTSDLKLTKEKV